MTDDEQMATEEFAVGHMAHELGNLIEKLLDKQGAPLQLVFDSIIASHLALGSLIITQMEWRAKRSLKRNINERLVQIRH